MTFQQAFKKFSETLRRDKGLYISYQANIAMAYVDNARWCKSRDSYKKSHEIGNKAADYFLNLLLAKSRPQKRGVGKQLRTTTKGLLCRKKKKRVTATV